MLSRLHSSSASSRGSLLARVASLASSVRPSVRAISTRAAALNSHVGANHVPAFPAGFSFATAPGQRTQSALDSRVWRRLDGCLHLHTSHACCSICARSCLCCCCCCCWCRLGESSPGAQRADAVVRSGQCGAREAGGGAAEASERQAHHHPRRHRRQGDRAGRTRAQSHFTHQPQAWSSQQLNDTLERRTAFRIDRRAHSAAQHF